MSHPKAEVEETLRSYLAVRGRAERGEHGRDALADFVTDDAVFIDPAWGRVDRLEELRKFFAESMAGVEGWTFPHEWHVPPRHPGRT